MTVSVAMATYNGMTYLARQIDSVLSQIGTNDELVVSDDGSTDGTREWLKALCARDPRVRLIDGPQTGVVDNFEHALKACKGERIFLCDQDDEWFADKYETVMRTFDETDAWLVMHDAVVTDADGNTLLPSFFATRDTRTGLVKNLWKNSYIGCCMAFSRRLYPYILPFEYGIPMHDQWIGLQAERHGKVVLIKRPLMAYRRHGDNATGDTHGSLLTMLRQRLGMIGALCRRR